MKDEELLPCPFCGDSNPKRITDRLEVDEVWCTHCPASNTYFGWQKRMNKIRVKKFLWQDVLNTRAKENES
jgi:adenosine deaminase